MKKKKLWQGIQNAVYNNNYLLLTTEQVFQQTTNFSDAKELAEAETFFLGQISQ